MPRLEKVSGTSLTLAALQHLVNDPDLLRKVVSTSVRFVPTTSVGGAVAVQGLAQLVDVVLADLLATVYKTAFRAALTALEDARAETEEVRKQEFRVDARGALREAYLGFEAATKKKQNSLTYRASGTARQGSNQEPVRPDDADGSDNRDDLSSG